MYSFFTFFYTTLNFYLVFCIFLERFLTLCIKTYYTAFIVYHSSFLGKSFRWFWYYCFSQLNYTCLLGFFWVAQQNKESFKSKNSVGRKCCQLKVLKALLMHLFVTLLINKTTGSDNRHFFFNTLEKENKEEFLTCFLRSWSNWKKNFMEATIPGYTIQSSFKQVWVILQVYSITFWWHKLEPWTNCPKKTWYNIRTSPFPQL